MLTSVSTTNLTGKIFSRLGHVMQCLIVAPFNIATLRLGGIVWLSLGGFAFKEMVCWFNQKPSPLCWVFSCSRKEKQQWGSRSFRLRVSGQTLFFKPPLLMFYSSASSLEICQRRQQLQQQQTSNNLLRLFVAWMKVCATRRLIDWKAAQTRFRPIKSLQLLTATIAALSQTPPCWSACDPTRERSAVRWEPSVASTQVVFCSFAKLAGILCCKLCRRASFVSAIWRVCASRLIIHWLTRFCFHLAEPFSVWTGAFKGVNAL